VHESLHLFREYVVAMTDGGLDVETRILHLPDLDIPVHAEDVQGRFYAGPTDVSALWYDIDAADIAESDWWWLLYPSHVPEQHPDFARTEFITGGMATGPDGASPCFSIADRFAQVGQGVTQIVQRGALGLVGPEQPGQDLARVSSGVLLCLNGQIGQQGAHFIRFKPGNRLSV